MDEFIKLLNKDYELVKYRIKDKAVIFNIQSSKKSWRARFAVQNPYGSIQHIRGKFKICQFRISRLFY